MEKTDKEIFGKRLYWILERKGLTIQDLSKETGLSVASLSTYETGSVEPTLSSLMLIAGALDASLDYLCGRTRQRSVTPTVYLRFDELPENAINRKKAEDEGLLVPPYADIIGYVVYSKANGNLVPVFDKEQLVKAKGE